MTDQLRGKDGFVEFLNSRLAVIGYFDVHFGFTERNASATEVENVEGDPGHPLAFEHQFIVPQVDDGRVKPYDKRILLFEVKHVFSPELSSQWFPMLEKGGNLYTEGVKGRTGTYSRVVVTLFLLLIL